MNRNILIAVSVLSLMLVAAMATAADASKARPLKWDSVVIDLDLVGFAQGFAAGNASGGVDTPGRFDAVVNFDGDKAGLWKGFKIESRLMYRFGSDYVVQGGVLAPYNTTASLPLPEGNQFGVGDLIIKQKIYDKFVLELGRIDNVNSGGWGYGKEGYWNASFASPVINAITIPPVSPFGGRVVWLGTKQRPTFTIEVFDSRNTPTESGLGDLFSDGTTAVFALVQPSNFWNKDGAFRFHVAYTSKVVVDFENPIISIPGTGFMKEPTKGSWSSSLDFSQSLVGDKGNATSFFGSIGFADRETAPFELTANFGVRGTSRFAYNNRDNWGVGIFFNGVSKDLKRSRPLVEFQNEYGLLTYFDWELFRWFSIGLNAQVINPGVAAVVANASGPGPPEIERFGTDFIVGMRVNFKY
jgi:porin